MGYIGNDSLGRMIQEHLNKQGFNLDYLTWDGKTDISGILSFSGDRVILAYHSPHHWTWVAPEEAFDWVYLSS